MTDTITVAPGPAPRQRRYASFAEIKAAKADGSKPRMLRPGPGLYLWISPTGTKSWRCKFQPKGGKETTHVLGRFPEMSIRDAQVAKTAIRETIRKGGDPRQQVLERVADRTAGRSALSAIREQIELAQLHIAEAARMLALTGAR